MKDLRGKCLEYFNTDDLYEVLSINKDATAQEIKKAYYKLSLLVHPDRVEEAEKEAATEKFKILGKVHSTLQDEHKRQAYDDTGCLDDDSLSTTNWTDYWRAMFRPISTNDIDRYKKEYIGSNVEIDDIKQAYTNGRGSMNFIIDMVPFSNCDEEPRIMDVVRKLIEDGQVEEYECFFNEPQNQKNRRHKKWERKKRETERLNISDNDIAMKIQRDQEKRSKQMIDLFSSLEEKYTKKSVSCKRLKESGETSQRPKRTRSNK